ncbi:hypothetical protein RDT67_19290 [Serratia fonticola]|uniref:Uncharacterized protein n=1 Tax=Serratia fonticola TaxID=47917 RepID=A0AAJ1YDV9_SERFO|nr:hypothetical protein [Serratia fonticola]MDQ9128565.1 hypothetical protein [Serratia fonticola]
MSELTKDQLSQLKKAIPQFKKTFSEEIRAAYQDNDFKLKTLKIITQKDEDLDFSYEYFGACTLFPGEKTASINLKGVKGPKDFFDRIDQKLTNLVDSDYKYVR